MTHSIERGIRIFRNLLTNGEEIILGTTDNQLIGPPCDLRDAPESALAELSELGWYYNEEAGEWRL